MQPKAVEQTQNKGCPPSGREPRREREPGNKDGEHSGLKADRLSGRDRDRPLLVDTNSHPRH